jgi:small subunit ribosomal protein S17
MTTVSEKTQSRKRIIKKREGVVISNLMDKTAVVKVTRLTKHAGYEKYVKHFSKFFAHDPKNECEIGDKVRIVETRPLSKRKRWRIQAVLEKAV